MKEVTLGQRCPRCGGELMMLSCIDPMSFNMETITKIICTKCNNQYKEEDLNQVMTKEITGPSTTTTNVPDNQTSGLMGWICPKCGRALSPYTNECPCSIKWDMTCNSSNTSTSDVVSHNLEHYIGYSRKDKLGYE